MKYFLDTEFLEGSQKTFFGETKPTIDLISIGIVDENGREYYAISKDFNLKEAWNRYDLKHDIYSGGLRKVYWIRENVLKQIWEDLCFEDFKQSSQNVLNINEPNARELFIDYCVDCSYQFEYDVLKGLIKKHGKSNRQIAFEVLNFVHGYNNIGNWLGTLDEYYSAQKKSEPKELVEFYAYYGSYDWVAFCWLFGKMIDLPKGFPMYCNDLKQIMDEKANTLNEGWDVPISEVKLEDKIKHLKSFANYPKQSNEHNALADAKWNKKLYDFLNSK